MRSVIKWGLKLVMMPNVNRPIGSMRFGKYKIFPVYYAPSRKCNLVSLSQLEDHGF
jgi:hypothetical protein